MLTRRQASAGLLAATVLPATAAGRPVTVASLFGDDKPETRIWLKIRDILAAKAPGRFDLRIVGNAALGGEKEVAEGVRLGSVQASLSTISALSSWVRRGRSSTCPSSSATGPTSSACSRARSGTS
jgi:TRAP-type C4-dicarboxylate transport system substrate-binding protein